MADNADIQYAVSSEIYGRISELSPEFMDRLWDIGADYELAEGAEKA